MSRWPRSIPSYSLLKAPPPYLKKGYEYFLRPANRAVSTTVPLISNVQHQAWILCDTAILAYEDESDVLAVCDGTQKAKSLVPLTLIRYISKNETDVYIFQTDSIVIVAFRGTEPWSISDWWDDAKAYPLKKNADRGYVHRGFSECIDRVYKEVIETLGAIPKTKSILVTGHSLGGALTVLFADRLAFDPHQSALAAKVSGLCIYGAPKVGEVGFGNVFERQFRGRFQRYTHGADPIPKLPPQAPFAQYCHFAPVWHIDYDGKIEAFPEDAPVEGVFSSVIFKNKVFTASEFLSLRGIPGWELLDHVPLHYSVHLWNRAFV